MLPFRQGQIEPALTSREREVLECIASGLSSKEAAQRLNIAPRTIERHVENLRNKLRARNKTHLVAMAVSGGFLQSLQPPSAAAVPSSDKS
jgi:DNA-binding CsgD family transcriptional regulator